MTMNYFTTQVKSDIRMKLLDTTWNKTSVDFQNGSKGVNPAFTPTITSMANGTYCYAFNFYSAFKVYADSHSDRNQFFKSYLKGFYMYGTVSGSSAPQFHSAESSTAQYRPYLKIVYTYTHDIPVENNGIYSLKNAASGKYLTVNASDDNAYLYSKIEGSSSQVFRFVGGEGCFKLQTLSRSGKALGYDYVQDGLAPTNGNNVMGKRTRKKIPTRSSSFWSMWTPSTATITMRCSPVRTPRRRSRRWARWTEP